MLKESIKNKIEGLSPYPFRKNSNEVVKILDKLNISKQSYFAQLYLTYTGPFDPIFQNIEILEITDIISPNIIDMTEYFREHFLLSEKCIALSDDAFGIIRIYNIHTDNVLEIDINEIDTMEMFDTISYLKQWNCFEQFLDDFFTQPINEHNLYG